ncbi:acyl-CoA synthetase (AMP-forming)/AMP-acid ligase II [Diaminobutyricimonas aerilata]|uniref:Acyl-CoA synthetase (AMP-forming)/AMP-acid ligase II n=1 Tax=Diaminobutyricimonas aerilata TaxID=1162967 RepID=A0A2M9CI54_9MICO|nr:alpha/beta fold hydrolase [Diaminobutyricimonas aerilata]PJJ71591.1 acyl-CoA synthetase (AMP-forming)/AMP-acid ligase II [Diaminobutyricimonas aerilata]
MTPPRVPAQLPPAGLAELDPATSRLVTVGGDEPVTWHVLDSGPRLAELGVEPAGTILCVHGNPTWSYLWRRMLDTSLARAEAGQTTWRVVAPDQLEMGWSERTGRVRRLADRVADLGRLTDALELDGPVVTLGHDWGGVVSLGWAVDHPDRLAAVTLLNTAVHQPAGVPIPAPLRVALQPAVLTAATERTTAFLDTTLALARPALRREVRAAYRAPYAGAVRRAGIRQFVADIPVDGRHPSAAELDRIADGVTRLDVPSLLLWGPADPIFGDRYLDDLLDRMPRSDVHRFEGAGHLIAEDVACAPIVFDWLADRIRSTSEPTADPAPSAAVGERRPMWTTLIERSDDDDVALVELAPPGRPAPRRVPWSLLSRRVREVAAGLHRLGVREGDRVSLLVPPGADLTAALYACLRIGAVVVVADAGLGLRGLTRAVRGAQADWIIGARPGLAAARALGWPGRRISTTTFPPALARPLGVIASLPQLARDGRDAELPAEPAADALAAVLFTSGSTGPAKGVLYTHGQLEALRDRLAAQYGIDGSTGLVAGFAPFALLGPALGARTATPDMDVTAPRTLTARAVAAAVDSVRATVLFLSPAAIANVVATADDLTDLERDGLASVRTALSAGAPVAPALLDRLAALLPAARLHTPYGMTEGLLMTDIDLDGIRSAEPGPDARVGGGVCVGRPADGVEVRIAALDADGNAAGTPAADPEVTGEIVVTAPHLKTGYDRLFLTDRAAAAGVPDDGRRWHRTGDVGHLDAEGRLWIEGRMPHVAVTADGPVTPVGVEQRLETVEGVTRAGLAAIGPRGTQQLVAVLETPAARRAALADLDLATAARTAAGLPLAAVLTVPTLPTDIRHNSKIDRTRLSRWADDVLAGGRMRQP